MKKIACLFMVILLVFCGCSKTDISHRFDVQDFSYKTDYSYYKNDPGTKQSGFKNAKKSEIETVEQAVKRAKRECTVEYDTIDVAFDNDSSVYRISFYKEGIVGEDQSVYLRQDGITLMINYGE